MANSIHPTAIIEAGVSIGENVSIGPYSWIRENVTLGDGCEIGSHVVLCPGSILGKECHVLHHAVLGEIPQDLKFGGEETIIEIGDRTVIREFVTQSGYPGPLENRCRFRLPDHGLCSSGS